jgi:YD repeat-containing protein
LSESWADGAGRTRKSRTEHPNSVGGFSGSLVEYNILGQVKRSTVPTEIGADWLPAGDDANRGFLWTQHEYDWKGRPTNETNTDGTFKSFSYNGCGCAGGQVTTIQGEQLVEGRRTQKIYADILGREFKSEVLNWDGGIYSSSTTTFDGADRPKFARQFEGSAFLNNPHQTTMMTYDGFGRLKTQHRPEQDNGTATTYNYLPDGRIQNMIDARGAITNYTYLPNTGLNAGVLSQVSYSVPSGSNISVTPSANYTYNNLGMPISMTDGVGSVNYVYNNLGQMTSENRLFNDSLPNSPTGGFKLEYSYSMSGQLKSLKDPYGQQINYQFDKVGRLNTVAGSTAFAGVTNYANTPTYTAFGALKSMNYGNGTQMALTFNNRLQTNHFELKKADQTPIMQKNYEYYADGNMRYMQDQMNPIFDRLNTFDQLGRPKEAKSSAEARGETVLPVNQTNDLPYRQSYEFNAFSNMTQRNNLHWGVDVSPENFMSFNLNYTYQNNRVTNSGWQYDADGRNIQSALPDTSMTTTYDAKGQPITQLNAQDDTNLQHLFDGNGSEGRRIAGNYVSNGSQTTKTYFIKSSVLGGQTITEYSKTTTVTTTTLTKTRYKSYVRAAGTVLAFQLQELGSSTTQKVNFQHYDASGLSYKTTLPSGLVVGNSWRQHEGSPAEMDALGGNVGLSTPYAQDSPTIPEPVYHNIFSDSVMYVNGQKVTCYSNGSLDSCSSVTSQLQNGSGVNSPLNSIAGIWSNKENKFVGLAVWNQQAAQNGLAFLGQGSLGYIPVGVSYSPGTGLGGNNVTNWFPVLGTDNPQNFISEKSAQLYSALYGGWQTSNLTYDVPPRSGPCDLQTVDFDKLNTISGNPAAFDLLNRTFGNQARIIYAGWETYDKAVFLNTVAGINHQSSSLLSTAKFDSFYNGDSGTAKNFGFFVTGLEKKNIVAAGLVESSVAGEKPSIRSPENIKEASVEATLSGDFVAFDLDLHNAFGGTVAAAKHAEEVLYNKTNNTTTHPADVVRRLNARGVTSGVSCKPKN